MEVMRMRAAHIGIPWVAHLDASYNIGRGRTILLSCFDQ